MKFRLKNKNLFFDIMHLPWWFATKPRCCDRNCARRTHLATGRNMSGIDLVRAD